MAGDDLPRGVHYDAQAAFVAHTIRAGARKIAEAVGVGCAIDWPAFFASASAHVLVIAILGCVDCRKRGLDSDGSVARLEELLRRHLDELPGTDSARMQLTKFELQLDLLLAADPTVTPPKPALSVLNGGKTP